MPLTRLSRSIVAAFGLIAFATAASAEAHRYSIDPSHTTVGFWVKHIGYAKTWGQFTEVSGSYSFDETTNELTDLEVVVPTASVFTNDDARDGHVRDADFLNADDFPEMTFIATDASVTGDNEGKVTGDLTLLGVTKPVTLDVTLNKADVYPFGHKKHTMGVSARGMVKRSEFGMTYALGGIVGDDVEIVIEMEAIRE